MSRLKNKNRPTVQLRIKPCISFWCRLRGLTFRKTLPRDWGLFFVYRHSSRRDTSIHMLFVFTALAVIWLDENYRVVDRVLAKPWRPFYAPRRAARYILETHPDRLQDFAIGDEIVLLEND